ncbi:F-pilin subunit assembly into extended F pili (plasmid) [Pseudomonas veronii 1YdBTEX2]|uniref:Type IV secretion system protein TraC n=2 Tax=Pseudomonas veronii TaxID=76761 RepID=A0A7Y1ACB5_PSEVE|nr:MULTISPECIES: type IV secretion system protein TraC [Pseudomonas]KAA0946263.1 type IV secretion system protein TraC [Pseudomonas sp. ANT_H4]NMY13128.1 type IV secretion system protein TraC [Pseudomonas veronii]SBW85353.1 F-pilin subunit assembly into extended F pili [Pseudomonas veronii 1YdBTEX2]
MAASKATIKGDRVTLPQAKLTVRAVDPESKVFFCSDGTEHYLGACFISDALTGASTSTVDKLQSALSMAFPPGTFIQIGMLASPDVGEYIDAYVNNKPNSTPILRALTTQHANLISSGVDTPLVQRSGVLLNRQRVIVTVKFPCRNERPEDSDIATTKESADRITEALKAASLNLFQLDAVAYLVIMRIITKLWDAPRSHYDEAKLLKDQIYYPGDSINYDDPSTIKFNEGSHYAKALSVKFFPQRTSLAIMNHMIGDPGGLSNQITDPYYMVLTLHYPDQVVKVDEVKNTSSIINHQVFGPTAHLIPVLGYKKKGIDTLVHEIEGKGAVVVEVNFTIFLFSRSLERLNKLSSGLQAYYTSLAFELREDKRILEALWNNLLPLNTTREGTKNLFRFHTMGVRHAVQFLPILGEWTGSGMSGAMLLLTRRGQPALIDLYDSTTNYSGIIFAEAGAGKSFLTQKFVADYLASGAKVWVIDAGRSYLKLCKGVGGEFIEFRPESDVCLNPFTHIEDLEEEMDILKATIAKMAAPEDILDDYQLSRIEQAITSVYTRFGNSANIRAIAEWFIAQSDDPECLRLGRQLFPFAGGQFTRWFEGENNLDMSNAFICMELSDLKGRPALQQVVLLQLISRINHDMYKAQMGQRGRKKILIVDEAWELLDDPMMAKAMIAAYRKARKEDGAVLVVTQSIGDVYASKNCEAIAANSAWQFILQQKTESIDSAIESKQFKIEAYGQHMLKSVHTMPGKYSEIMVKRSDTDWGIVRLVVDKFHNVMFSTKGPARNEILDQLDQGVDAVEAVNDFIEREAAYA